MAVNVCKAQVQLKLLLFFRNDLAGNKLHHCRLSVGIAEWFASLLSCRIHIVLVALLSLPLFICSLDFD